MKISKALLLSFLFLFICTIPAFKIELSGLSLMQEGNRTQKAPARFDEAAALREATEKKIPRRDLPGWLEYKRAEFTRKQNGTWETVVANRPQPDLPTVQEACPNGNFEYGAFNSWQALAGTNDLNGLSLNPSAPLSGRHTIMSGGSFDPVVGGTILPVVNAGSFSARLGDSLAGSQAEGLTYTFTVTPQNKNFTFSYAIVLQDAGHPPAEQPFFMYEVKTSSNATIKSVKKVADANNPYFKSTTAQGFIGVIVYKNWDCEAIDLSAYLGQTLTITFVTADCTKSGHFGYAYIDGICADDLIPSFTLSQSACRNGQIIANGTASKNETDYFWSIAESDANWVVTQGTEVSEWFPAQQAGLIDLRTFYWNKTHQQFKCNTYYRIKLAVKNGCVPWKETVKLLYISCAQGQAGLPRQVCCNSSQPVQLGSPPIAGQTYSWVSTPAGFTSSLANPLVTPPYPGPTNYTVTTTTADGCTETTGLYLECAQNGQLSVDISTGTWNQGVKAPVGADDFDWQMRAVPGMIYPASAFTPTVVVKPNTRFFPWAVSTHANWISPQINSDGTVPSQLATANNNTWPPNPNGVEYYYEYQFFLDANQFNNVRIEIYELAADNTALICLNSQVLSGPPNNCLDPGLYDLHNINNFGQLHGTFLITSGFVNGLNTLLVQVRNGGGDPPGSPTGLLLYGKVRGTCK